MQGQLDLVQSWCTKNRLTLNVNKTKFMTFMSPNKRKMCHPFRLYMKGRLLDEVDNYKYLGTLVDNKLSGEPQYGQLTKKGISSGLSVKSDGS